MERKEEKQNPNVKKIEAREKRLVTTFNEEVKEIHRSAGDTEEQVR